MDRIINDGLFSRSDTQEVFGQIVDSVKHMHKKKVAHLDIKLDNVFLDLAKPPKVKLGDFGWAANFTEDSWSLHRSDHGTPAYWPPEIVMAREKKQKYYWGYGAAADIWSLGVTLYVLVVGQMPFGQQSNLSALIKNIMTKTLSPEDFKGVPQELQGAKTLIQGMLVRDPLQRFTLQQVACHPFVAISAEDQLRCKELFNQSLGAARESNRPAASPIVPRLTFPSLTVHFGKSAKRRSPEEAPHLQKRQTLADSRQAVEAQETGMIQ